MADDSLTVGSSTGWPEVVSCEEGAAGSLGLCSVEPDAEPLDGTKVALLAFPGDDGALVAARGDGNRHKKGPLFRSCALSKEEGREGRTGRTTALSSAVSWRRCATSKRANEGRSPSIVTYCTRCTHCTHTRPYGHLCSFFLSFLLLIYLYAALAGENVRSLTH